jgi:hypothetical protein
MFTRAKTHRGLHQSDYQNWKSSSNQCTFSKEKTQPKKKLLLCREPGGALGIGVCVEGGPSAQRCTLPTAPASSRQRPVNCGKPWSTDLPRAGPRLSTQVASLPTASRSSRRQSYILVFLNSVTFAGGGGADLKAVGKKRH